MFSITFPNVGHGTLITTTMLAIFTMKVFDLVYIMTGGGPGDHTEVLPFLMYQIAYSQRDFGMGTSPALNPTCGCAAEQDSRPPEGTSF